MVPENSQKPIRIICFGDSNTWGYSAQDGMRFPPSVRWTGVLQSLLGNGYEVIEEGLNGRTTNLDYENRSGRNGRSYLIPCMDSHHPLDYVILFLGSNDLKAEFARSPEQITAGMEELVKIATGSGLETPSPATKVLLVAPPRVEEGRSPYGEAFKGAHEKSLALVPLYGALAKKYGLIFLDLSQITPSPVDGVHLSEDAHKKIGSIFFEVLTGKKI